MNVFITFAINDYPFPGADLNGCLNDQTGLIEVFNKAGIKYDLLQFQESKVQHDLILNELGKLSKVLKGGVDTLTIHYSGHGSYAEVAGKVREGLFPHDGQLVYDFEFIEAVNKFDTALDILAILDSCFSGGMGRALLSPNPLIKNRFYLRDSLNILPTNIVRGLSEPSPIQATIISGCSATQTSADYFNGTKYYGALSKGLMDTFYSGLSKRQWKENADKKIQKKFEQDPQLIGSEKWMDTGIMGNPITAKKGCLLKFLPI